LEAKLTVQNDFFTIGTLATFAGATGATTIIANGIQRAFNLNPRWLALSISELICVGVVFFTHRQAPPEVLLHPSDYFVAVVNGFLVFATAAGTTSIGSATGLTASRGSRGTRKAAAMNRHFFTPWFSDDESR
jgi:hypothetical protein